MHACMHPYIHASIHPSIHPSIHTYIHTYIYTYYARMYVCTYIPTYIYIRKEGLKIFQKGGFFEKVGDKYPLQTMHRAFIWGTTLHQEIPYAVLSLRLHPDNISQEKILFNVLNTMCNVAQEAPDNIAHRKKSRQCLSNNWSHTLWKHTHYY